MASVDSTIRLGEIFLETSDGTRITLGQLKAWFGVTLKKTETETPAEIKIGSMVKISNDPKCACGMPAHEMFKGQTGKVVQGPSYDLEGTDWYIEHDFNRNWISAEHLTVVS